MFGICEVSITKVLSVSAQTVPKISVSVSVWAQALFPSLVTNILYHFRFVVVHVVIQLFQYSNKQINLEFTPTIPNV